MSGNYNYKLVEIDKIGKLPPASQIAVKGLYKNLDKTLAYFYPLFSSDGCYYHHGVYLGNEKCEVAHFSGANKKDAKPRRCDIIQFLKSAEDRKLYRVEYDCPALLLGEQTTLAEAEAALENPQKWPGYGFVHNNCETFATWLMTGERISAQAIQGVQRGIASTAAAIAVASSSIDAQK